MINSPIKLKFYHHRLVLKSPFSFKDQAKAIPTAKWEGKDKTWRYLVRPEVYMALEPYISSGRIIPSVRAKRALDLACTASQQCSSMVPSKKGIVDNIPLPIKTKPYSHQSVAFQIARTLDQSALLMEQGTGKTLSAIATAGYRYNQGQIKKLLIVCPLSVISVWHNEFEKHADFPYRMIDLTKAADKKTGLAISPRDRLWVVLVNYESSWRNIDILTKWKPDMIIADESQKIKSGKAKQSKGLFKLGDSVKYKMILTGTPVTQGPLDIWSQYRFLNPDIFGRKFTSFRNRYAIMEGLRGRPEIRLVVGYKNLQELAEKAHSIAYRVTKKEALDLPSIIDQIMKVQLSPDTRRIYREMKKDFMVSFSDEKIATAPIILTQLLRLQQITGGFLHTEDGTIEKFDSAKMRAVKELLSDLPNQEKVIIFARFSSEIKALEKISQDLGNKTLLLDGSTKNRGKVIDSFQNDPKFRVIVIQIQTGGLGITLTSAHIAIFYSTTFSFADYEQAKARLHRIGQNHSVTYIHLVTEDTVDENILDILISKGDMATQIIDSMRKKIFLPRPFTNTSSRDIMGSMDTKRRAQPLKPKSGRKSQHEGRKGSMYNLDNRDKGGWHWDETTGNIVRRNTEGKIETLATGVSTLNEASDIVANQNKKIEGESPMAKNTKQSKKSKKNKAKKATQVIQDTVEVIEEEVGKTEVEAPKKDKKNKKGKSKETSKTKKNKSKESKPTDKASIDENSVGVKELAEMVNMDPKALRKVLREEYPEHEPKSQWIWKRDSKELSKLVKKLNK